MAKKTASDIRILAENDLLSFIKLVAPHRMLGSIHEELIAWWTREEAKTHQLALLPRGHQKSMLMAYRVAWEITKNPAITILYISSTSNLAEKQLKAIKDILTSPKYRKYWPEMVLLEEGKREKWAITEIAVDHPKRKEEMVRDPTVFTAGLSSTITGMHCDIAVMDDLVVRENAYTEEGREKVRELYSLLSSIENTDAREWIVGTRYYSSDLYSSLIEMETEKYDEEGNVIGSELVYEVFQREVEDAGDGTGEFIWPRQRRPDGKWFGFDANILSKKKAQYLDKSQFRAQYYNDPNMGDNTTFKQNMFQYYDKKYLTLASGFWYFRDKRLNIIASIDFAFSVRKKADWCAIVVAAIDEEGLIYVLDIDRFKTNMISEYYTHIFDSHLKWGFRKIRAEITSAQVAIVKELKERIKQNGSFFFIEEVSPTRYQGKKEERIEAILEPKYQNNAVLHYKGGNCQLLEEELMQAHPDHDDIKDAFAMSVEKLIPPKRHTRRTGVETNVVYHPRFGGISQ